MKPSHFVKNRADYYAQIDNYFQPLGNKCVKQLKRCIDNPSNQLWEDYLYPYTLGGRELEFSHEEPWLTKCFPYQEEHSPDDLYIPFSDTHKCAGKNHRQAEMVANTDSADAQEFVTYFANPLQYGSQDINRKWLSDPISLNHIWGSWKKARALAVVCCATNPGFSSLTAASVPTIQGSQRGSLR